MEESGGRKQKKEMKQIYYNLNNKKGIFKSTCKFIQHFYRTSKKIKKEEKSGFSFSHLLIRDQLCSHLCSVCKFRELSSLNVPILLCVRTLSVLWAPIWRHLVFIPLPQSNFTEKLLFWSACLNHYLLFIAIWKAVLHLWSTSAPWRQTSENILSNWVLHWYALLVMNLRSCRTVIHLLLSAKSLEASGCIKEKSPRSLPPIPSWGQAMKDKPEAQLKQQKMQVVCGWVNLCWALQTWDPSILHLGSGAGNHWPLSLHLPILLIFKVDLTIFSCTKGRQGLISFMRIIWLGKLARPPGLFSSWINLSFNFSASIRLWKLTILFKLAHLHFLYCVFPHAHKVR